MRLKQLLAGLPIELFRGAKEQVVTGLCSHSKRVRVGDLFIAKRGAEEFIEEALRNGAVAVLTDLPNPAWEGVAQLVAADPAHWEPLLAARFYGSPSEQLFLIGITGTNGKTTTAYLTRHLLIHCGRKCGLLSTVEYDLGRVRYTAERTTPDIVTNQRLLREMVSYGNEAGVMEVTSHGLIQGRVEGLKYSVGVFTNLTQDHLDYHETMEAYREAKRCLFLSLESDRLALLNRDDPAWERMAEGCRARIETYGLGEGADLRAEAIELSMEGSRCEVVYRGERLSVVSPLIGRFNLYNLLAALGSAHAAGLSLSDAVHAVATFPGVPGRLERVKNRRGLHVFVDYAHTEDALRNVLSTLREVQKGRLITLFGCGGNRDRGKRPKMAAVAEEFSDRVIVTNDNPRQEDPDAICREILAGFRTSRHSVELDRAKAIAAALQDATPEDLVLIAGKGHEAYQVFAHQTVPFEDKQVVQELLR